MIELKRDELIFTFPEIHKDAQLQITFQRTLRVPDDDNVYPLPPGLGNFPLKHVDDFSKTVPGQWTQHGGVMFPMYQSYYEWQRLYQQYQPLSGMLKLFSLTSLFHLKPHFQ